LIENTLYIYNDRKYRLIYPPSIYFFRDIITRNIIKIDTVCYKIIDNPKYCGMIYDCINKKIYESTKCGWKDICGCINDTTVIFAGTSPSFQIVTSMDEINNLNALLVTENINNSTVIYFPTTVDTILTSYAKLSMFTKNIDTKNTFNHTFGDYIVSTDGIFDITVLLSYDSVNVDITSVNTNIFVPYLLLIKNLGKNCASVLNLGPATSYFVSSVIGGQSIILNLTSQITITQKYNLKRCDVLNIYLVYLPNDARGTIIFTPGVNFRIIPQGTTFSGTKLN